MKTDEQFHSYIDSAPDDATRYSRMLEYADALREWGCDSMAEGWAWIASNKRRPYDFYHGAFGWAINNDPWRCCIVTIEIGAGLTGDKPPKYPYWWDYDSRIEAEIDAAIAFAKAHDRAATV